MMLKVGTKVVYAGKGKHALIGKQGTVMAALGDGGYEVMFGRDLWFAHVSNLTIKK